MATVFTDAATGPCGSTEVEERPRKRLFSSPCVAIVSLLAEEERPTPAVSRGEMQQIRAELAELAEELRKSTKANRARTEKAEAASGRALEQVGGVDTELSDLSRSSAANDRRIRRLSDDLERLREEVDNLGFGDAFP